MKCTYQMTDGSTQTLEANTDGTFYRCLPGILTPFRQIGIEHFGKSVKLIPPSTFVWSQNGQLFPFSPERMDFHGLRSFTLFLKDNPFWRKFGMDVVERNMTWKLLDELHFRHQWMWDCGLAQLKANVRDFYGLDNFVQQVNELLYRFDDPGKARAFTVPQVKPVPPSAPKPLLTMPAPIVWNAKPIKEKTTKKKSPKTVVEPPKPTGIRKFKFDRDL